MGCGGRILICDLDVGLFRAEADDDLINTFIGNDEVGTLADNEKRLSGFIEQLNDGGQLRGGRAFDQKRAGAAKLEGGVFA